jgi:hypothetical protein
MDFPTPAPVPEQQLRDRAKVRRPIYDLDDPALIDPADATECEACS